MVLLTIVKSFVALAMDIFFPSTNFCIIFIFSIQCLNTQHNGIPYNDTQHITVQNDSIQHNETHNNDNQHYDIKHNNKYNATLSLTTFNIMAVFLC